METNGNPTGIRLKKQLGLISTTSYIVGSIIGVSIFISPTAVLEGVGSSMGLSLLVWAMCGALTYCGAMCYAEFGTRVKKSGGTYTYIREAFGDLAGFVFLWTQLVIVRPLFTGLACLATAEYIMRPVCLACPDMAPTAAKAMLAFVILGKSSDRDNVNMAVEEVIRPHRTIPIAILGGLAIPTLTYILGNVAYHAVLTNAEIQSGVAVAVVFGERKLGFMKWIILPCVAISAGGIANAVIFTSCSIFIFTSMYMYSPVKIRVRIGLQQPMLVVRDDQGDRMFLLTTIFVCLGDVKSVLGAYAFYKAGGECLAVSGIVFIRRTHPDTDKTYKVHWLFPCIYVLAFLVLPMTAVVNDAGKYPPPFFLMLLGVPLYYMSRSRWWRQGRLTTVNSK